MSGPYSTDYRPRTPRNLLSEPSDSERTRTTPPRPHLHQDGGPTSVLRSKESGPSHAIQGVLRDSVIDVTSNSSAQALGRGSQRIPYCSGLKDCFQSVHKLDGLPLRGLSDLLLSRRERNLSFWSRLRPGVAVPRQEEGGLRDSLWTSLPVVRAPSTPS